MEGGLHATWQLSRGHVEHPGPVGVTQQGDCILRHAQSCHAHCHCVSWECILTAALLWHSSRGPCAQLPLLGRVAVLAWVGGAIDASQHQQHTHHWCAVGIAVRNSTLRVFQAGWLLLLCRLPDCMQLNLPVVWLPSIGSPWQSKHVCRLFVCMALTVPVQSLL